MAYVVIFSLLTGLSTVSTVLAIVAWRSSRKTFAALCVKLPQVRIERLENIMADMETRHEQLHHLVKRQHARLAARDRRELAAKGTDAEDQEQLPLTTATGVQLSRLPAEDDVAWKRRIRMQLAQGKLNG